MASILGPQRFELIVDREKFERELVSQLIPVCMQLYIHACTCVIHVYIALKFLA